MAEAARSMRYCGREIEDDEGIELPNAAVEIRGKRNKEPTSCRFTAVPSGKITRYVHYYGGSRRVFQS